MAALVIRSLNVLLGIFFTFLGTLKITPAISRELHKDLRAEYAKFAKVLPGAKSLGYKVPSKYYRRGVGVLEILCGEWGGPSWDSTNIINIMNILTFNKHCLTP